jgi:hypothetical protein
VAEEFEMRKKRQQAVALQALRELPSVFHSATIRLCLRSTLFRKNLLTPSEIPNTRDILATSGRQFECTVDDNFALVLCLTPEQKTAMQTQRQFPFAW